MRHRYFGLYVLLALILFVLPVVAQERPTENPNGFATPDTVSIPGTVQPAMGCPGEWAPDCEASFLEDMGDDMWQGTFLLPAGDYEYKAALNGSWDQNYGANGEAGGPNIALSLAEDTEVTFIYDHLRGMVIDSINMPDLAFPGGESMVADSEPAALPEMVNIPGTIQPALGCPGEWAPDCEASLLEYNDAWDVWLRTFDVPAGSYEYKVAINGSWDENYGGLADPGGANISLTVPEDQAVTFIYDHKTHWVADDVRHEIVTAPGSYQSEVGCEGDFQADCLATWLQDPDGDGVYTYSTNAIPAGDYTARASVGMSMDETYGVNGEPDGEDITFTVPEDGTTVSFIFDANMRAMVVSTGGTAVSGADIREQRAHWVTENTLLWAAEPQAGLTYKLIYSPQARMSLSLFGLTGVDASLSLEPVDTIAEDVLAKFPHLEGLFAYQIVDSDLALVPEVLRSQMAIAAYDGDDLVAINGLQIPGVLDDLYTYSGDLGVTYDVNGIPAITVWAPTAQNVEFLLFEDSAPGTDPTVLPMAQNSAAGTWRIVGQPGWDRHYYLFRVTVYAPTEQAIVVNDVTDPYSVSLSLNSTRSQLVNLSDADLMPDGWASLEKPSLDAPEDITVYELHVRDFSAFDESVPEELRGTYEAFTLDDSNGMAHLQALQASGLTHLHLLPTFDIATINENKPRWFEPDYEELAALPSDSEEQQAIIDPLRDLDGFNWGYDPYHYNVPEGSYSTDPDGVTRIIEYRDMVQSLNEMGLRVVQDVVYNHTNSSGQSSRSVLDRIVPGYYHRLNARGAVETSTCCQNTATEHNMMRRLMIDSVVLHAMQYKVDGFRFDLMGHHMLDDMIAVRAALDSLTLEEDGVDGSSIYIYGEGWNFGEVENNARGINATQLNIAGTGIGVFNDRLRDAVRGGNPFGDRQEQGLSNGQYVDSNGLDPESSSLDDILLHMDQVRASLAGNLMTYTFIDRNGDLVDGTQVDYGGNPAAYTLDPQENIVYVGKHDNETLYDNNVYKTPDADMDTRVRMQILGLSYTMYAQGVPFFQAGTDMLRSKSLDRNSYNSGDWFNRLDWTYQTNNFGVGLPPAGDNSAEWPTMQPLLADPSIQAGEEAITATTMRFQDMLRVRYSTPLLRLRTAEDINARMAFHNTGPDQMPGVIVMSINDTVGDDLDANYDMVLVVFNGMPDTLEYTADDLAGLAWELHPVLADGHDDVLTTASADGDTGTFTVPAYSTAVYVVPQG